MKAETIIYCLFSALKPFRRNKIPVEKKIRAVDLRGLSYRQVGKILQISHTTLESSKTHRNSLQAKTPHSEKTEEFKRLTRP
jgi:hypothetical protein